MRFIWQYKYLAHGSTLVKVEVCLQSLAREGGQLGELLVQEEHALSHLCGGIDG